MDESQLNPFSRTVARDLFAAFPEWRCLARVDHSESVNSGCLSLEVPNVKSDGALRIDTTDEEVTIGFDRWHEHFNKHDHYIEFGESQPNHALLAAIETLKEFTTDKRIVQVTMSGDRWCGSRLIEAQTKPDLTALSLEQFVYTRSWSGIYDRKYHVAEVRMIGIRGVGNNGVIAKFICGQTGMSLIEARKAIIRLMFCGPVSIIVPEDAAKEISQELHQLGVDCTGPNYTMVARLRNLWRPLN